MRHPTKGLLVCLIFFHSGIHDSLARERRDIFSWFRGSDPEPDAIELGPSQSVLKVHKYSGVKINPVPTAPIHMQRPATPVELTPLNVQQLELLNRVSTFLPDGERLQNYDFTVLYPYVELIPVESLEKIQCYVASKESNKNQSTSKLLTVINWLKAAKERKLKLAQQVMSIGANLVDKKKKVIEDALSYLRSSSESTTSTPVPATPSVPTYPFSAPSPPNFQPFGPGGISNQPSANLPPLSDVVLSPNVGNLQYPSPSSSISQSPVSASKSPNNQNSAVQKPQLSLSVDFSNDMNTHNVPSSFNQGEQQYSKVDGNHYGQPLVQTFALQDQFLNQPIHLQQSQIPSVIFSSSPLLTNNRLPLNDHAGNVQVQQYQYPQTDQLFNNQIHQLQNQNIDALSASTFGSSQPINHLTIPDEGQSFHSEFQNKIAFDHRMPANTYFSNDLISSASDNLEQIRQQTSKIQTKPENTVNIVQPETSLNFTTSSVTKLQEVGEGDVTRLHRITSNNTPVYVTSSEVTGTKSL